MQVREQLIVAILTIPLTSRNADTGIMKDMCCTELLSLAVKELGLACRCHMMNLNCYRKGVLSMQQYVREIIRSHAQGPACRVHPRMDLL